MLNLELECASCSSREKVQVVCHHCGKPLCHDLENCRFEIEDKSFSRTNGKITIAIHCKDCWKTYHPQSRARKVEKLT